MPAVSIIIPVLDAEGCLGDALASALAQSCGDFEIVIAPDEPRDYQGFAARDPRIRILPGVPQPTGPGPARNRALEAARGDWIAQLDADDAWSPNYLEALLAAAPAHGAAFARTSALDEDHTELRSIPAQGYRGLANFALFERAYGSFHALVRREEGRRWLPVFAEDVLFDMETLALRGGRAPYVPEAVYRLQPRARSATRGSAFISGIAEHYRTIIDMIHAGRTAIPNDQRAAVVAVFESWAAMNARYLSARAVSPLLTYQRWVAASEHEIDLA